MIKKLTIAAAVMAVATPALAGSIVDPVVEPVIEIAAEVSDWTGFFVGVDGQFDVTGPGNFGVGVHAGYLHDMGDFVLGAEVNYNYIVGPGGHEIAGAAILGYDAGMFMPHVTVGASGIVAGGPPGIGWNAGGGVSMKLTDSFIATGRYRYISNPGIHQVRAQLSYQF